MATDRKSKHRIAPGWGGGVSRIYFVGGALCAATVVGLLLVPALTAREVAITLLHTADVHGHVAAVSSERENGPGEPGVTGGPGVMGGGLLRCATRIEEIRRRDANVILVDCGDLIQGSPESFLTQGRIVVEAVRQLRYDALVPGNHEFDGGVDALRHFYAQAQIPVLAANIRSSKERQLTTRPGRRPSPTCGRGQPPAGPSSCSFTVEGDATPPDFASEEPALPGAVPFLCKEVDGIRVVVVGLSNPLIPLWSRPRLLGDVTFETSLVALRRVMPLVRAQKPDILVLAAHQGWREWGDDPANEINVIARAFPEFNVILGAHTHQAVEWKTVNGVAYTQAGCYGLWLGVTRLVFDTQTRRLKSKQIQLLAVDSTVAPDKTMEDQVAKSLQETKTYLNQAVGVAAVELEPTSRVRGQSAIQTLIAGAIAERVQADVVIHRALTEASLRAGRITMRDVWRIVPYDNYIGVAHLTLDELRQILEENSGFFKSREFRGVYGLTYDLKPKAPAGERISNIRLNGKQKPDDRRQTPEDRPEKADDPPSPERFGGQGRVRMAFNSYDMASAGGRFRRLRAILDQSTSRLEECPDVDTRAAVLAYLHRHQPLDIQAAPGAHVVGAR